LVGVDVTFDTSKNMENLSIKVWQQINIDQ